jgi:phospholipid N-methyltransferase
MTRIKTPTGGNDPTAGSAAAVTTAASDENATLRPSFSDFGLYMRKLMRDGLSVAAMKPSSKSLAAAHCRHVDSAREQVIVEIGAGTGAVTQAVLDRMHPRSTIVAVEIDQEFAAILRRRCPAAIVLCCDAAELPQRLKALHIEHIDLMISCIALPHVPVAVNEAIFGCFKRLGRDAVFTQQTLVPMVYRRMYTRMFEEVRFRFVPANLPPGGVYHCRRLRPDYRTHLPGKR